MWMNLRKHNIEWKEGLGYKQHETLSIKLKKKLKLNLCLGICIFVIFFKLR